ncbi:MAG: Rpn family recombination-promoting nuclease/putative transposase [Acidobacteriota bacterium]
MGQTSLPVHDRPWRLLFSHPEVMEDLLRRWIRQAWVDDLDLSTLDRVTEVTIAESLKERVGDIIWKIRWGDQPLYLFLLVEFQSTSDRWMALRLLVYVGQLYQELVRRGHCRGDEPLPPVLPIVIYNGERPWRAPTRLGQLFSDLPHELSAFQPAQDYVLIDERRLPVDLAGPRDLVSAIAALEQSQTPQGMGKVVERLVEWLGDEDQAPLRRAFAAWIRHVLVPARFDDADALPEADDLMEVKNMLEETVKGWTHQWLAEGRREGRQEGRREGRQEGRREGEATLLQEQLRWKFGRLPAATEARLRSAAPDQLRAWGRRLLSADSLQDVWGDD